MLKAKDVTPEMKARAIELAKRMKRIIETRFAYRMSESEHKELRGLRKELENMGFWVTTEMAMNASTCAVVAEIELFVLKDNTGQA